MTSPLSLVTFGLLAPAGGGGGNVYLTGGIEVSIGFEVPVVANSLAEVAVSVAYEDIDASVHDDSSNVGLDFHGIAVSA